MIAAVAGEAINRVDNVHIREMALQWPYTATRASTGLEALALVHGPRAPFSKSPAPVVV